ncbi:hypothetical protein CTI12_AA372840 [Artemisia annua]|uniref:DUF8040 domain-containing protein n=1 Tax=Artemisia annua TaxID=35608 RepID=A0A2U1MJP1_ARTAN|nr:hypothetical protein CTI12_AA372840 [Artemisia annua]
MGQYVPTSSQSGIPRQPNKSTNTTTKPKIVEIKRKGRSSAGSTMFKEYMAKQDKKQEHVIKILEFDVSGVTKDGPYSISKCMTVINGLIDGNLMTYDIPLLYLAMDLFEDVFAYFYKYMHQEPCMTSSQTREAWMNEVLNGNLIQCVNAFRMHPTVFLKLCEEMESSYGLKSSDRMTVVEKLSVFVYTLALGVSNRDVGERFQCSRETITKSFHEVLEAITARSKGFHGLAREMI